MLFERKLRSLVMFLTFWHLKFYALIWFVLIKKMCASSVDGNAWPVRRQLIQINTRMAEAINKTAISNMMRELPNTMSILPPSFRE